MTEIYSKFFSSWRCDNTTLIKIIRAIIKNNALSHMNVSVLTDCDALPDALVELGLFESKSDARRKRPDLFTAVSYNAPIKVGKVNLYFHE